MGRGAKITSAGSHPRGPEPTYREILVAGLGADVDMRRHQIDSPLVAVLGGRDFGGIVETEFDYDHYDDVEARVTEAEPLQMIYSLVRYSGLEDEQVLTTAYAMERLLTRHQMGVRDLIAQPAFGYHDEEVPKVHLDKGFLGSLTPWARAIEATDGSLARVTEKLLELENGHVLPQLEGASWSIEHLDLEQILVPSKKRREMLDSATVGRHVNMQRLTKAWSEAEVSRDTGLRISEDLRINCPVGVATLSGGAYRLIDGYHRNAACHVSGRIAAVPHIVARLRDRHARP